MRDHVGVIRTAEQHVQRCVGAFPQVEQGVRALPSRSLERDMTTSGGLLDTTLSDVIGARLCCPCWSVVATSTSGRATTWRSRDGRGGVVEFVHVERGVAIHQALRRSGRLIVALSAQPSVKAACADFVQGERGVVAVSFPTARVLTALRFPLDGRGRIGDAALKER